ncbi:LLM class F420-dependent oxidoreductase [Amycolatopsis viridis]|uniref:F420-dependent oxidoreductase n=1 Tax=Amycolatopsis viridis TaxID=185678 RepID=A0ABX0SNB9_9PSEU|nr:LLM class F420-dependent oxidoreductase [Amycolatopsis viridis]NIH78462.1 putative F420-dependent oxidoreductase [Amycolatopsis viridis]
MKFGINLINNGPGVTPEVLTRRGQHAEDIGLDLVMISDHVAITEDVAELYPAPFYDPLVTLAFLAGHTSRIELGTTVLVVPYRHPLLLARMTASLDQLSGGRLVLGVGLGWAREEYAALGVDHAQRAAITDEYLAVLKATWTSPLVSYEGEFVRFTDVRAEPLPHRKPHIPLWVGGQTGPALRRVARFGDVWHPLHLTVEQIRQGARELAELAEEAGRAAPAVAPRLKVRLTDYPVNGAGRVAGSGTLDQIRADLHALEDLGVAAVVFDTYDPDAVGTAQENDLKTIELLAEHVVDLTGGTIR